MLYEEKGGESSIHNEVKVVEGSVKVWEGNPRPPTTPTTTSSTPQPFTFPNNTILTFHPKLHSSYIPFTPTTSCTHAHTRALAPARPHTHARPQARTRTHTHTHTHTHIFNLPFHFDLVSLTANISNFSSTNVPPITFLLPSTVLHPSTFRHNFQCLWRHYSPFPSMSSLLIGEYTEEGLPKPLAPSLLSPCKNCTYHVGRILAASMTTFYKSMNAQNTSLSSFQYLSTHLSHTKHLIHASVPSSRSTSSYSTPTYYTIHSSLSTQHTYMHIYYPHFYVRE